MALNKSGKVEIATILVYVLIAGAIAYVANFGGFQDTVNGFMGKSTPTTPVVINTNTGGNAPLTDTSDCPTSGTTTLTVNVQDALSTTATTLYPEYYLFNGNQLIKEGTLSSTANTISVSCGKDYKLLLINTTALTGIYAKTVDVQARIAQQTVNAQVVQYGGAIINYIANPDDVVSHAPNVTLAAGGGLKNFDISFKENETQKGFNRPLVMCQANITTVKGINLVGFSDGTKPAAATLPKRVTATSGCAYYVWEYPKMLDQTMSSIIAHMTIEPTATAPTAGDTSTTCMLADQATWKTNKYKTATSIEDGFKTSAENSDSSNSDVGAYDSAKATLYFDSRGY
jgi:hypothetical protein